MRARWPALAYSVRVQCGEQEHLEKPRRTSMAHEEGEVVSKDEGELEKLVILAPMSVATARAKIVLPYHAGTRLPSACRQPRSSIHRGRVVQIEHAPARFRKCILGLAWPRCSLISREYQVVQLQHRPDLRSAAHRLTDRG